MILTCFKTVHLNHTSKIAAPSALTATTTPTSSRTFSINLGPKLTFRRADILLVTSFATSVSPFYFFDFKFTYVSKDI